jgi:drug/metabolite transporter (DMT)-like permease
MLGEASALVAAFFLSAGSIIVSGKALNHVEPLKANLIRVLFGALSTFVIAVATGDLQNVSKANYYGLGIVIISAIVGYGAGDTLLYKSINKIGVSTSYTVSYTYPFFTIALGVVFLSERCLFRYFIGTTAIVLAIAVISFNINYGVDRERFKGILMALGTAALTAVGIILVSFGLRFIGVIVANAVRFPILFLIMLSMCSMRKSKARVTQRDFLLLALSGVFGMTLSSITFLYGIQLIGAARASSLYASSPIWVAVMSTLFLKERLTWKIIASCVMVVAGIYFLT